MAAGVAIAAGAVVLAAVSSKPKAKTAIPKAAAGLPRLAPVEYTVSLPNNAMMATTYSLEMIRQLGAGQAIPVEQMRPTPQTAPRNAYVDPAIGTGDKALNALTGAVNGASAGVPLAGVTAGLSIPVGAVVGAAVAWFGDWFHETILEDKRIPWNDEFRKERVNADDTLWRQVVKVSDGEQTLIQERIVRESSWPPFIDFELGRRVIG